MWSPQHYQKIGKSKGISQSVLLEAIRQIEEVQTTSHLLQPILTLNHLAILSCTDVDTLRSYVTRTAEETYRHFKIRKRSGGYRRISVPVPMLNVAQSWMAHWVLRNAKPHHSSKAFCPGDSIVKCARVHTNSKWLIKIDIADFFGSITEIQVYRAFRHLGYNPLISFEMTRICTEKVNKSDKYTLKSWQSKERKYSIPGYSQSVLGRLPQGAPTSPMLSNLIMYEADGIIKSLANTHGLRFTRYSDDMTFSTKDSFSREKAIVFIQAVSSVLKKNGLFINRSKTKIVPPGARKVVLGLLVDGLQPNLSKEFKDKIRQHLFYLNKFGIQNHVVRREFDSIGGLYRHLDGLINFANMVDPIYAKTTREEFERLPWAAT